MVLSAQRVPPPLSQLPAVMVLLVRTMSDGSRAEFIVHVVMLLALRFVICDPFPEKAPVNLSETTFIVPVVALM